MKNVLTNILLIILTKNNRHIVDYLENDTRIIIISINRSIALNNVSVGINGWRLTRIKRELKNIQ